MATINKKLEALTLDEIKTVSERYLMGWHDLYEYGFRIKGLNNKREIHGLPALTTDMSFDYRVDYIRKNYTIEEITCAIRNYLRENTVGDGRWRGIEILDCRFGREYAKMFKTLLGGTQYRKISEETRVQKMCETSVTVNGGVGLANKQVLAKAKSTNIERYGVENVMQNDEIKERLAVANIAIYGGKSPFSSNEIQAKAINSKLAKMRSELEVFLKDEIIGESVFSQSPAEKIVFCELVSRFGKADVYHQYGIHPYDARYPFSCDFYIKSLDLFIEINLHYSHGGHWFDCGSQDDLNRKNQLLNSDSRNSRISVDTWCNKDVIKRNTAKASGIKYLVFWDNSYSQVNKTRIPNLKDFYKWFSSYNCDYEAFISTHPQNTY